MGMMKARRRHLSLMLAFHVYISSYHSVVQANTEHSGRNTLHPQRLQRFLPPIPSLLAREQKEASGGLKALLVLRVGKGKTNKKNDKDYDNMKIQPLHRRYPVTLTFVGLGSIAMGAEMIAYKATGNPCWVSDRLLSLSSWQHAVNELWWKVVLRFGGYCLGGRDFGYMFGNLMLFTYAAHQVEDHYESLPAALFMLLNIFFGALITLLTCHEKQGCRGASGLVTMMWAALLSGPYRANLEEMKESPSYPFLHWGLMLVRYLCLPLFLLERVFEKEQTKVGRWSDAPGAVHAFGWLLGLLLDKSASTIIKFNGHNKDQGPGQKKRGR